MIHPHVTRLLITLRLLSYGYDAVSFCTHIPTELHDITSYKTSSNVYNLSLYKI
jgi:hypothetical protein